ncbi:MULTISPECIES: hypothetical protein [Myxococcus]|nr:MULTISPECIES: hypothetical protein [Myxococcus]NOJ53536.1 hypothetical protein [Myxococcus xanthus]QPM80403.1 hypothetical protein I5Q59_03650 [Myxococcus xanthus]QVW69465.1 hypothetical protein JTM82_07940 [Myxococcus xanthus DZ2]QZZ48260.1 hypothetical protein MyxoNM_03555 [Myxococcus xanthus]UEO04408.1 hypothetical protein K1515_34870 [Myxococcus xanthus DZ2]
MRSLNPVFSSAVVMALCSLLAGGCGGSPSGGESDTQTPQSGGLGGKAGEGGPVFGDEPTYPGDDDATPGKVTICHIPPGNPANAHTISVSTSAWPAHERHGDTLGPCEGGGEEPDAGSGEEPDAGGGEEPDAGSGEEPDAGGGEEPDAGAPVCAPIGEACGESAACCLGLMCGEDNTCDPVIG